MKVLLKDFTQALRSCFFEKRFQGTTFASHLTMDAPGFKLLGNYLIRICRKNYLQQMQGVETNYCKFVTVQQSRFEKLLPF